MIQTGFFVCTLPRLLLALLRGRRQIPDAQFFLQQLHFDRIYQQNIFAHIYSQVPAYKADGWEPHNGSPADILSDPIPWSPHGCYKNRTQYPTKSDIWRRRGVNRLPFLWVEDTSSLHAVPPFHVFHTLFRIMSNGRFHDLVIIPVHLREIFIRILNIFIYKIVIRTIPSIRATMAAARVP